MMNEYEKHDEPEMVACKICMKEIPVTEAKSSEAQEYAMYFCGLDCYEQWQSGQKEEDQKE
jgi:hypothetical protein